MKLTCLIKRTTLSAKFSSLIHVLIFRIIRLALLLNGLSGRRNIELLELFMEIVFCRGGFPLSEYWGRQSQRCCLFRKCIQILATPEEVVFLTLQLLIVDRLKAISLVVFDFLKNGMVEIHFPIQCIKSTER